MHFAFTPEQLEIRDDVRSAFEELCPPGVVRKSWKERNEGLWEQVAELGVLGLNAPDAAGGMGLGAVDWVLVLEEAGRCALPEPLIENMAAIPFLVEAGETALVERIVAGEAKVALCDGDGYAADADRAELVLRITGGEVHALRNCRSVQQPSMDRSRRLFSVDGDSSILHGDAAALRDRAVLACSAQLLGLGRHVLDAAVAYSKERRQFGKPIGGFQAVQNHLVDALLKLQFAAPMVYRAACSLAEGHPDRRTHIAMAKIYASEAAYLATRKSLQVHGAIGYTEELDLQLWMKRIWALTAAWGSPAEHRAIVADEILGEKA
jgi:alkylation response protein AidB-like acyl-CoA dehydrogenase